MFFIQHMNCHLLLYLHNYLTTLQLQRIHAKCPVMIFTFLVHSSSSRNIDMTTNV